MEADDDDEISSIVIDVGETYCKLGYGGDKTCRYKIPTLVSSSEAGLKLYGDDAIKSLEASSLRCPISRGRIQDRSCMEDILDFCFRQITGMDPAEENMLITSPQASGRSQNEHLAQYMFESANVKSCYFANPCILALAESGRTTGLCMDCGEGSTSVLPIVDGHAFKDGMRSQNLAGYDVTLQLDTLISKNDSRPSSLAAMLYMRDIKQRFCVVSSDSDEYMSNISPKEREKVAVRIQGTSNAEFLNRTLNLNFERFAAPEVLFQPRLSKELDGNIVSLPRLVYDSIMECSAPQKQDLFSNIVIAGATSIMPGFIERFHTELSTLVNKEYSVKVIAPPERNKSVWMGGSILSGLSDMNKLWITKFEYAEFGPSIVERIAF